MRGGQSLAVISQNLVSWIILDTYILCKLTGKIEGKIARGKQRLTYISRLIQWMGKSERDILRTAKDRELWKSMATNVLIEYGT